LDSTSIDHILVDLVVESKVLNAACSTGFYLKRNS
jgi:hypothetical protein